MDVGLLIKVGLVVAVLGALWVVPAWSAYRMRARRLGRWLDGGLPPEPETPRGPPVERLAADTQRIGEAIRQAPPGMPVARLRGWLEAYDEVLVAACRALELDQGLESLRPGPARDLERDRVERMLVEAGLLAAHGEEP